MFQSEQSVPAWWWRDTILRQSHPSIIHMGGYMANSNPAGSPRLWTGNNSVEWDSITTFKRSLFFCMCPRLFSWLPASVFWEVAQPRAWPGTVGDRLKGLCRWGHSAAVYPNHTHARTCNATHTTGFLSDSARHTTLYSTHSRGTILLLNDHMDKWGL